MFIGGFGDGYVWDIQRWPPHFTKGKGDVQITRTPTADRCENGEAIKNTVTDALRTTDDKVLVQRPGSLTGTRSDVV